MGFAKKVYEANSSQQHVLFKKFYCIMDNTEKTNYPIPSAKCLEHAFKLGVVHDKAVMPDYWTDSLEKKVLIGVRDNEEKLLIKSEEEYTSPISKIFQTKDEYIIMTENSIYIVSKEIETKGIR